MTVSGATEGTILVTGASGLAGSAVIREFNRSGHRVRALVRNRANARTLEAFPTVEVVESDVPKDTIRKKRDSRSSGTGSTQFVLSERTSRYAPVAPQYYRETCNRRAAV